MNLQKHIPNALTLLNLCAGILAILFTMNGKLYLAGWLILLAAFFDLFDGMAARALKVQSPIGADLDSLADAISFGLAPAMIIYKMMWLNDLKNMMAYMPFELYDRPIGWEMFWIPLIAFWIAVAGVIRLAIFNNDTRQTTSFIGLPIPSSGLFFAFLPIVLKDAISFNNESEFWSSVLDLLSNNIFLAFSVIVIASMMLVPLPMFSLKFKGGGIKNYIPQIGFLAVALVLFFAVGNLAVPLLIVLYILYSLIKHILNKKETNEIQSSH
jgi:CDP-diacylglycerol--serine O-phosphatidyltransferase